MKGSEYAFPMDNGTSMLPELGLTKRELFAAMAMQGTLSNPAFHDDNPRMIAEWAAKQADALLAALEVKDA